jgi:ribosomal protein S14
VNGPNFVIVLSVFIVLIIQVISLFGIAGNSIRIARLEAGRVPPPCEICGQPGPFCKFDIDETETRQIMLCRTCFAESIAADIRESRGDQ